MSRTLSALALLLVATSLLLACTPTGIVIVRKTPATPFRAREYIPLVIDRQLPALDAGNKYLQAGDRPSAITSFKDAVVQANRKRWLLRRSRAKTHYALGVALALDAQYDAGIAELGKALSITHDRQWAAMLARVQVFKEDAAQLERARTQAGQPR